MIVFGICYVIFMIGTGFWIFKKNKKQPKKKKRHLKVIK